MKIVSVVGARPQLVKLAPIAAACATDANLHHVIVHTGQHYDPMLSDAFFTDLQIPAPDIHLGVGSGSHGTQTGAMLTALEEVFLAEKPDWVLAYGDTNSTLAAAIAAVKLKTPLAHLEAGLRSFNREMPEEHNRVLTDHAADLLLAPSATAMQHLAHEGLGDRSVLVYDVMTDVCLQVLADVRNRPPVLAPALAGQQYLVATIHRPVNTDDPARLQAIVTSLTQLPMPVVLLAHPRLRAQAAQHDITLNHGSLTVHEPLGYLDLVRAVSSAAGVITDSGGLQKEAYLMGTPCTTLRNETEWVETLADDWNVLIPSSDLTPERVHTEVMRTHPTAPRGTPYGNGTSAALVVKTLQASTRTS